MVKRKRTDLLQLILLIAIVILINIIGRFAFSRFDLTTEKRYTLSPATKQLIRNLDDVVYLKIYLEGDFPAGFKRLRNSTKEMLDEFRVHSPENNIQYEFINPSASSDEKERNKIYHQLAEQGLKPTNLQVKNEAGKTQQIIFPGAIVTYKGRSVPLQLLKSQMGARPEEMLNSSIEALEYEISNTIRKLSIVLKPRIAFIEGHGELNEKQTFDISKALSEYYTVERVKLNGQLSQLKGFKAAIVAKPDTAFSEKDKFILDQFAMQGGRILWCVESIFASMDSLEKSNTTIGIPYGLNLEDQFFRYGVRVNTNLIQDMQSAPIPIVIGYVGNQPQQQLFPWFYFPLVTSKSNHPIVNNLNAVKFEFVNSLDTINVSGLKKTILLTSSKYTKLQNAPARISLAMIENEPKQDQFNKPFQPVAVLVEGKFTSVYKNRVPPQIAESKEIGFKAESDSTKMIFIADGDVLRNGVHSSGQILPLGVDRYTGQEYGNRTFILNCMNYLLDEGGLISVRSREIKLRLLDRQKIDKEKSFWQVFNTTVPVLIILIWGIGQNYYRKRKYSR